MGDDSYDDLATYLGTMTDEAIASAMYLAGFGGSPASGFEGSLGGPGGPSWVRIGPLGGRYEGSTFTPGGQVTDATPGSAVYGQPNGMTLRDVYIGQRFLPFFDTVQGLIDYFTDGIMNAFEPWWQIPRNGAFQGQIASLRSAAQTLAINDDLATNKSHSDTGPASAQWGPNNALGSAVDTADTRTAYFDGQAAIAFQIAVTSRLGKVLAAQDAAICTAYIAAAGEEAIWDKTRQSLASIAGHGVEAMKHARGGGGGSLEALLMVAGAVALVAAPLTGGASVAVFGASEAAATAIEATTNAAGVLAQTSSVFVPTEKEDKAPLSADDPVTVLSNVVNALEKLKTDIANEETGIQNACRAVQSVLGSQKARFDLSEPDIAADSNPADFTELRADRQRLNDIADLLTDGIVVGGETCGVTAQARKALGGLADALDPGPWARPYDIGLGGDGPYRDYASLIQTVWTYLDDTITYLGDAASVLRLVAKDFDATDAVIHTDLAKLDRSVLDRAPVTPPSNGLPPPEPSYTRLPSGKVLPD